MLKRKRSLCLERIMFAIIMDADALLGLFTLSDMLALTQLCR